MNTKISKINMNKIIVLIVCFSILILLTAIINSFSKFEGKNKVTNNKNEYSSGNQLVMSEENKQVANEIKTEPVAQQIIEQPEVHVVDSIVVPDNINNETIQYFENTEDEIELLVNQEEKLSSKIKAKFVELVDFIFYGTEINGVTFDELTDETKQKLIDIVNRIDSKIEEKVPGYKETISSGAKESYTFLIDKLKKGIDYADAKIEEKIGTEKYDNIKENVTETKDKIKEGGSVVIEKGKELFGTAKDKIKNWYEGWK